MIVKHFLQLIIFSFCFLCSNEAFCASVEAAKARAWSEEKGRELINNLAEEDVATKYRNLDNLFMNYIDLDHIAQFVMGKYWRTMSQDQKERYIPLFKRYSLALYKSYPLNYNKENVDFTINRVQVESNHTLVLATITLKGLETSKPTDTEAANILVEFRLHEKNGNIMLTDLKIAETSFILTYRNRFAQMIEGNDGDIEWFLEDLETATISTEKNNELVFINAVPIEDENF